MPASNPFNFNNWLHHDGDGGDDISEDITLGQFNQMTADLGSQATIVKDFAGQNSTLVGQNSTQDDGAVGVFGESDGAGGAIGVAGASQFWGVAGTATASQVDVLNNSGNNKFQPFTSSVGVFGAGDNVGVYGQSRTAEDQRATTLPPGDGVGVYGNGDNIGVVGQNDRTGNTPGTGVTGQSFQGIGVIGQSGVPSQVLPYIGVYGVGQTVVTLPYPINRNYSRTGVFGIGDLRGGVFQTTPPAGQQPDTFANVQFTPLKLPQEGKRVTFTSSALTPRLPTEGKEGDILAVDMQHGGGSDPNGTQLWVCIKERSGQVGTTWARVSFDAIVTTR
jgi:hypothetical protein